MARMRRACLASAVRAASARNCEILKSWCVISIADMLPAPRINDMLHRVTVAVVWESPQESGSQAAGISFERRFLMFDFDADKLIIVGIVALIVIGPKELPRVMLQVGQAAAKMRRMAAEFRSQFMDAMREAEIDDIKSYVERLTESAKADTGMNPLAQITAEFTQAIDSAEKPAMLPSASTRTAIAGPEQCGPLLNSIAGPCLPEAPEEVGLSFPGSGHAPTTPEDRTTASVAHLARPSRS